MILQLAPPASRLGQRQQCVNGRGRRMMQWARLDEHGYLHDRVISEQTHSSPARETKSDDVGI